MSEKKDKFIKGVKKFARLFKYKVTWVVSTIVLLLLIAGSIYISIPKADSKQLLAVVTASSELTTAKIKFTGKSEYKDSGVAFINKSDFIMLYEAEARVGIDVEKVKITTNNLTRVVYVEIPEIEVFDVHVNTESIQYFDIDFALFNFNEKEDNNMAVAEAEKEAKKALEDMGIIPLAETQAETLIKGILVNAVPRGYKIEIKK